MILKIKIIMLLFCFLICQMTLAFSAQRSIAVFTFDNHTGSAEYSWIGYGFAEALSQKLRNLERIVIRSRREIARITRVAKIDQKKISGKNHQEIGKLVGSEYLIFGAIQAAGSISKADSPLRVTARLVNIHTGIISRAIQLDGTMSGIFEMQSRFVFAFANLLKVDLSIASRNAIIYHGTDSLVAYKYYCVGLRLLDKGYPEQAVPEFQKACDVHPGILYAEAHHAMGTAYLQSGCEKEMLTKFKQDAARFSIIWYELWVAYQKNGQPEKALAAFNTYNKYKNKKVEGIVREKGKR